MAALLPALWPWMRPRPLLLTAHVQQVTNPFAHPPGEQVMMFDVTAAMLQSSDLYWKAD